MNGDGAWLSILDYAKFKGLSISTVRRYVKASRVKCKMEKGKFFIFVAREKLEAGPSQEEILLKLRLEKEELKARLRRLEEENNDLKMLVDLYESNPAFSKSESIPRVSF